MSKFQSAVLELPTEIKADLDQLIEQDSSGQAIYRSLTEKYGAQIKVPTLPTIIRYKKYYLSQKQGVQKEIIEERLVTQFQQGIQEVDTLIAKVSQMQDQATFNKVRVLEGLVAKCLMRINNLETIQEGQTRPNTSVEQAIARYITEVKSIIESIIKMSSTLQEDERTLIQIVHTQSNKFLEVVRDVVLDVCPEKYDQFKMKLEAKLREQNISLAQIQEVVPTNGTEDSEVVKHTQLVAAAEAAEAAEQPLEELINKDTENVTEQSQPEPQLTEDPISEPTVEPI